MYAFGDVLNKNPIQIAGVAVAGTNMLIWLEAPWFRSLTDKQVGGINTFLILMLGLFVTSKTENSAKLSEVNNAVLGGIDLGKQIAPVTNVTNVLPAPPPPPAPAKVPSVRKKQAPRRR